MAPAESTTDVNGNQVPFETWCGLTEDIRAWRPPPGGKHESGSAIDLNYSSNPYIATRTGQGVGGESSRPGTYTSIMADGHPYSVDQRSIWQQAVNCYDNASKFFGDGNPADVSIRVHDSIETTYDRFAAVDVALRGYLGVAIEGTSATIQRPPYLDASTWPDGSPNFDLISERRDVTVAVPEIEALLTNGDPQLNPTTPPWTRSSTETYYQVLRDYEAVRTPMLFGNPADPISRTRNPVHGFLNLRREVVTTMVNIGNETLGAVGATSVAGKPLTIRWGASDFGRESGDVQHFDLGDHPDGFVPGP